MVHNINPYPANVENMVSSYNASRWQMGFNSAFKGLKVKYVSLLVCSYNNWLAQVTLQFWNLADFTELQ